MNFSLIYSQGQVLMKNFMNQDRKEESIVENDYENEEDHQSDNSEL
jgi:hypothetical protein